MKYIFPLALGIFITAFVGLTYESQFLACVSSAITGGSIGLILILTYKKDHA